MDEVKVTPEIRQKAVDFLNSDNRSTSAGIAILEEANYKPHVVAIFKDKLGRKDIPEKVVSEIRLLIRYHANPDGEIHKDIQPEGGNTDEDITRSVEIMAESDEYPDIIKKLISILSDGYKLRSQLHTELKDVGEGADEESNQKRAAVVTQIDNLSKRISILGEFFDKFKKQEEFDSNELELLLNTPVDLFAKNEEDTEEKETEFVLAEGKADLKRQLGNWRGKVSKAKNQLLYQNDKKQDKENPMPEGPKRIKIENRLARLEPEVTQIETALAKLS
jgi:hypothetical protein